MNQGESENTLSPKPIIPVTRPAFPRRKCLLLNFRAFINIWLIEKSHNQQRDFAGLKWICEHAWVWILARIYRNISLAQPGKKREHILNEDRFTVAGLGRWGGAHLYVDIAPAAFSGG